MAIIVRRFDSRSFYGSLHRSIDDAGTGPSDQTIKSGWLVGPALGGGSIVLCPFIAHVVAVVETKYGEITLTLT